MDNFKAIYRILRYLEKAMDYDEPDMDQISASAREVGTAAPYWFSPAVSAEPPPEPDLHVSAYPAPSAITVTVLEQV